MLKIIAHRGYSAIAPENTYSAFAAAIQHQVMGIEFDVRLSGDRLPVVIHDSTLNRTSNGQGKVSEKSLQELKELDIGSWFNPEFKGEKILTLEETLDFLIPTGVNLYVEIKDTNNWAIAEIDDLINLIVRKNCFPQCAIISFDQYFLQQIRQRNIKIILGYLSKSITEYQEKLSYVKSKFDLILCQYQVLLENPIIIEEAKKEARDLIAWTVDKEDDLNKLRKLSINSFITNRLIP